MDIRSLKSGVKLFFTDYKLFLFGCWTALHHVMSDETHLKVLFRCKLGYKLNLKNPRTFNEKLNWLKLYNRKPEYTIMVDKYKVKDYVAKKIGKEYVVPCLGVWDNADKIDFNALPDHFVIKTNHNSCSTLVCKDKSKLKNIEFIRQDFNHSLGKNLFYMLGEWPYKNVPPLVLAEKYLDDHKDNELQDYKFWCFNGKPVYMYFSIKRKEVYENFYDMDFNPVDIDHGWPRHQTEFVKPASWEKMKELAAILSKDIPFVRVDFYEIDGHPYFGELTFYDWAGLRPFDTYETDLKLGELIKLPNKKIS